MPSNPASIPIRLAVVGDPVEHSLSPVIHTAALESLGLAGGYKARRVDGDGLRVVMDELRAGALDGVNVTMPHKRLAAELVDELTVDARRSGSVNTIVRAGDVLVGHTTDVSGLGRLWRQREIPSDRPILVLGSGGSAAAACLVVSGATVYMSARRIESTLALGAGLALELVPLRWGTAVSDAVVVNATPLGMGGERLPDRVVELCSALIDLPYAPTPTPAVDAARSRQVPVIDGLDLLVAQAADSFRLWTGRVPPSGVMEAAARNPSRRPVNQSNHV